MKPGEEHSPEERLQCIGFWAIDKRVPRPGLTLAESCRKTRPSVESKSFVTLETERWEMVHKKLLYRKIKFYLF